MLVSNEYYSKWLRHTAGRTKLFICVLYIVYNIKLICNTASTAMTRWIYIHTIFLDIYTRYIELRACEFVILSHCIVAQQDINNIIVRALCDSLLCICTKPIWAYLYAFYIVLWWWCPAVYIYAPQPNEKKTDFQAFLFVFRHTFDKIIEYFPNTFVIS